jgi:spore maturation protein CgeB
MLAPVFHGYSQAIAASLSRRGHDVVLHHYDALTSAYSKARHKILYEFPERVGATTGYERLRQRSTSSAVDLLASRSIDVLLVIKGDVLLPEFWDTARQRVGLTHLWLYDEIRRMRHSAEVFAAVDCITTYSRLDQQRLMSGGREASYIPNAFDGHLADSQIRPMGQFLFVGARYPNREVLLAGLASRGLPVTAVGRDWSHHPIDRLRTWSWHRPKLRNMRDLSREVAYGFMGGALGNLNSHFDQDGFTMRTFEIPGMGGLQLIDRADVDEFFDPDTEVLIYQDIDHLADLCRRAERDRLWARRIGERARSRTLAQHTFDHRVRDLESLWG